MYSAVRTDVKLAPAWAAGEVQLAQWRTSGLCMSRKLSLFGCANFAIG